MRSDVPFYELWLSTESLHNRFYSDKNVPFEARHRVYVEETGEYLLAATQYRYDDMPHVDDLDVAKECADVIVTAMGLLMGLGISYEELERAVLETVKKNDAKTLASHEVRADGKIARRKLDVPNGQ